MKSSGVKVGTGLATCKVTVYTSATTVTKADGVVVNGAFNNTSDSMSCSIGNSSGRYAAFDAWYSACTVVASQGYFVCLTEVDFESR